MSKKSKKQGNQDKDVIWFSTNQEIDIKAKSFNQQAYIDALENENIAVVIGSGVAGTGKTMLATQVAMNFLATGEYKRLIITRPVVPVANEKIGFLPGGINEKMEQWMLPIYDTLYETYSKYVVDKMLVNGTITICPLGVMRGRTFKRSIMLLDEAQNSTPEQMKMILTRIGEDSRLFVTGDPDQSDNMKSANGLIDILNKLEKHKSRNIHVTKFDSHDIQRHPIIEEVLSLYNKC